MSKRRRSKSAAPPAEVANDFWGTVGPEGDDGPVPIHPTSDPGAVPRSLGAPPLSARSGVAVASLTTVYEEAVRTATALAAANGLLAQPAGDDE